MCSNMASAEAKTRLSALPNAVGHKTDYGQSLSQSPFTEPLTLSLPLRREPGAPHEGGCSPLLCLPRLDRRCRH